MKLFSGSSEHYDLKDTARQTKHSPGEIQQWLKLEADSAPGKKPCSPCSPGATELPFEALAEGKQGQNVAGHLCYLIQNAAPPDTWATSYLSSCCSSRSESTSKVKTHLQTYPHAWQMTRPTRAVHYKKVYLLNMHLSTHHLMPLAPGVNWLTLEGICHRKPGKTGITLGDYILIYYCIKYTK